MWNEQKMRERLEQKRREKPIPLWVWILLAAGIGLMVVGYVGGLV